MSKVTVANSLQIEPRKRGEGGVYLRGGVYWIRYYHRGTQRRESSESSDREQALKLLNRRLKEIWAERRGLEAFIPNAEKVRLDDLLDELEKAYKLEGGRAIAQFRSHLKPVREAFGDMRAVAVTAQRVDEYIDRRLEEGKAAATINKETQLLTQVFNLGIKRNRVLRGPHIRKLPENNARSGFFEQREFDAVVTHLPDYLRDFARFGYLSGWRKSEIASLTWADVDRGAAVIELRGEHSKNGRARKLALEGELAEILERRFASREYKTADGDHVGLSVHVFHFEGSVIGDFRKAWASACRAAGLLKPKLGKNGEPVMETVDGQKRIVMVHALIFHDLRRTAVRNMVRAGVPETVAMAISGHRTRAVFDRYNITSDEDLRQAVKKTHSHVNTKQRESQLALFQRKSLLAAGGGSK